MKSILSILFFAMLSSLFFSTPLKAQSDSTAISDSLQFVKDSIAFLEDIKAVFDKYELNTYLDSVSYSFGVSSSVKKTMPKLDPLMFLKGFYDNQYDTILLNSGFSRTYIRERNRQLLLARRNRQNFNNSVIAANHQTISEEKLNALKVQYADTLAIYEQFFKENGARPEVTTTAIGLQYEKIIGTSSNNGARPKLEDKVEIYYVCTDIRGNEMVGVNKLSNYQFKYGIKAWQEGIPLMQVGATFKFYVPYDLAYGALGKDDFRPFQPLIYTIELIKIEE